MLICLNELFPYLEFHFLEGFIGKWLIQAFREKKNYRQYSWHLTKKCKQDFHWKLNESEGQKKLKRFYRRYDNLYGHLFMIISYASHYSGFLFICCVFRCISNKVLHFFPGPTGRNCKKFPGPIQNFLHIWADDDVADR